MDYLKLKAYSESAQARQAERISARIIMTHTQRIINLPCIIRKHEYSHVIKVLLVVLLSSLCPGALSVLSARCWSFTEKALIYAAAWLLTYCLYVQSWLVMKSFGRMDMNAWKSEGENVAATLTVMKYFQVSLTWAILWFYELNRLEFD